MLGHASANITQVYVHRNLAKAIEVAALIVDSFRLQTILNGCVAFDELLAAEMGNQPFANLLVPSETESNGFLNEICVFRKSDDMPCFIASPNYQFQSRLLPQADQGLF